MLSWNFAPKGLPFLSEGHETLIRIIMPPNSVWYWPPSRWPE